MSMSLANTLPHPHFNNQGIWGRSVMQKLLQRSARVGVLRPRTLHCHSSWPEAWLGLLGTSRCRHSPCLLSLLFRSLWAAILPSSPSFQHHTEWFYFHETRDAHSTGLQECSWNIPEIIDHVTGQAHSSVSVTFQPPLGMTVGLERCLSKQHIGHSSIRSGFGSPWKNNWAGMAATCNSATGGRDRGTSQRAKIPGVGEPQV